MQRLSQLILLFLVLCLSTAGAQSVAYENARIWNGSSFEKGALYVQDGRFVAPLSAVEQIVDLQGQYVIPPLGDGHTHSLGNGGYGKYLGRSIFLPQGVFYAMDLTNPYSEARPHLDDFAKATTIDVQFAHGGITSTNMHPMQAMERFYGDSTDRYSLQGDANWFMDDMDMLERKWEQYLQQERDLVKIYITYNDRQTETASVCGYGICPEVARAIVKRAHAAGMRVLAHVNTIADVNTAIDVGVDGLAHLPSGNDGIRVDEEQFWLDEATLQRLIESDLFVIPTAVLLLKDLDVERRDTLRAELQKQRKELRRLYKAGVPLAIGADSWKKTSLYSATYLEAQEMFTARELLHILCELTPQIIYPERQIGKLQPGYEASFLVLAENPLQGFVTALQSIKNYVKQGQQPALIKAAD